jgi:hypothetical protein
MTGKEIFMIHRFQREPEQRACAAVQGRRGAVRPPVSLAVDRTQ